MKKFNRKLFDDHKDIYMNNLIHNFYGTPEENDEIINKLVCYDLGFQYNDFILDENKKLGLIPDEKKTIDDLTETEKRLKRQLILRKLKKTWYKTR